MSADFGLLLLTPPSSKSTSTLNRHLRDHGEADLRAARAGVLRIEERHSEINVPTS
jgi:hypothetical protein